MPVPPAKMGDSARILQGSSIASAPKVRMGVCVLLKGLSKAHNWKEGAMSKVSQWVSLTAEDQKIG